jgi:hypothetical protein
MPSHNAYENQYQSLCIITKKMLLDAGIIEDEDFDVKVGDMAIHILESLYDKHYSYREINNAIIVLKSCV